MLLIKGINIISKKKKRLEAVKLWGKKWWFSLSDFLSPIAWTYGTVCDIFTLTTKFHVFSVTE